MFADQQPISQLCILYVIQIVCTLLLQGSIFVSIQDIGILVSLIVVIALQDSLLNNILNFLQQKEGESALRLELISSI